MFPATGSGPATCHCPGYITALRVFAQHYFVCNTKTIKTFQMYEIRAGNNVRTNFVHKIFVTATFNRKI